jgi:hypothetical protein
MSAKRIVWSLQNELEPLSEGWAVLDRVYWYLAGKRSFRPCGSKLRSNPFVGGI